MIVGQGQASGFVQPWMADSATADGRARPRHGSGVADFIDSLAFVSHSFDLDRFICFFTMYDFCTIKQNTIHVCVTVFTISRNHMLLHQYPKHAMLLNSTSFESLWAIP